MRGKCWRRKVTCAIQHTSMPMGPSEVRIIKEVKPLLSVSETLTRAGQVTLRSWRTLLGVCLVLWLPYAALGWLILKSAFNLDALTGILTLTLNQTPLDPEAVQASLIVNPKLAILGSGLLIVLYPVTVSWVSAAASFTASEAQDGQKSTIRESLCWGMRRLDRSLAAYLSLLLPGMLAGILVGVLPVLAGVYAMLHWGETIGLLVMILLFLTLALLMGGGWLWLYARLCLVSPAAGIGERGRAPWRQSYAATRGHTLGVVGRVLLLTLIISSVLSVPSMILLGLNILGTGAIAAALVIRVGLSLSSALLGSGATTPIYKSLGT